MYFVYGTILTCTVTCDVMYVHIHLKYSSITCIFIFITGPNASKIGQYCLTAGGPRRNAFRILRAMQLERPLMLEGEPGVGKTSIVAALAAAGGHTLTRINLSEHTVSMSYIY